MSLFSPAMNCTAVSSIERGKFIIDAQEFYRDIYTAFSTAKQSVIVVGWDLNSATQLVRGDDSRRKDTTLAGYVHSLIEKNPTLHWYFLIWYTTPMYSANREKFTASKLVGAYPNNIHIVFDHDHPIGASHHQKIIVVDNSIAFVGGLDITAGRWDDRNHAAYNPLRCNEDGKAFTSTHDVHIAFTGDAVHEVSMIARNRWKRATGETIPECATHVDVDLAWNVPAARIAVSRTVPMHKDQPAIRQTHQLYLDLIEAAGKHIYVENQYFTSRSIAHAIMRSLRKEEGPVITIVLPKNCRSGIINVALCMVRDWRLQQIRGADAYGRLKCCYPFLEGSADGIYVHSKVMIVDDTYAIVGSSNLSDRSMGLDTECDVCIDGSDNDSVRMSIRRFLADLVSEHTGATLDEGEAACTDMTTIHSWMNSEQRGTRRLEDIDIGKPGRVHHLIVRSGIMDFKDPLTFDLVADAVDQEFLSTREPIIRNTYIIVGTLLGIAILGTVLWQFTGASNYIGGTPVDFLRSIGTSTFSPLWLLLLYSVGAVLFIPLNMLILSTATIFDAPQALLFSMIGSMLSSMVGYVVGRMIGLDVLRGLFRRRMTQIIDRLQRSGTVSITMIRLIPIAPFALVSLLAGAIRLDTKRYALGTFLGTLPGVVLLVFFQRSMIDLIIHPTYKNIGILALLSFVFIAATHFYRRRL